MQTINYTVLYGINGTEDKEIKPNVEFEAFEGNYKVGSYCLITDGNEATIELMAGQVITGVGVMPKKIPPPRRKKQEDLLSEDIGE